MVTKKRARCVNVAFDEETYNALWDLAHRERTTVTELVRRCAEARVIQPSARDRLRASEERAVIQRKTELKEAARFLRKKENYVPPMPDPLELNPELKDRPERLLRNLKRELVTKVPR